MYVDKKLALKDKKKESSIISLKMIGLYLYTIVIGYTFCSMLSIQNELILQK